ncbi:MAG: hypothetical protein AAB426_01810 [Myxococcota bacterium]
MLTLLLIRACDEPSVAASRIAKTLAASGLTITELWHARSDLSAALAHALFALTGASARHVPDLDGGPQSTLLTALATPRPGPVALCADEPLLSELVAWLALGVPHMAHHSMLAPGAVVWLEGDPTPAGMALRAHLTPAMLAMP